jgi:hypothetical protein
LRRGSLTVVFLLLAGASPGWAEPGTFADSVAPVFEHNCFKCHGAAKQKAGLRLDSYAAVLRGSDEGEVVKPGNSSDSELFRRITLPPGDEDIMPSGDSLPLSPAEISVLESWIAAGAPPVAAFEAARQGPAAVAPPAAPDYRPRLAAATELARTLGVRLVPRSSVPTDGLVLRTASAPANCDDAVLEKLAPVADIIVEAELARTRVTDKGMEAVGRWTNLISIDLTHTAVTSDGVARLASLAHLETLNLTETKVDSRGMAAARKLPALREVWAFGTP